MNCPHCAVSLVEEHHRGIEVDHCPSCNGRWLDPHQLTALEATVRSTEADRQATIVYARRKSELNCPVCGERMMAFNYRAYSLELDTCHRHHGFWLDPGEDGHVRDIIEDRVKGLRRAASAEDSWAEFLAGMRGGGRISAWDRIKNLFSGRR